jgi:hypothetical protein
VVREYDVRAIADPEPPGDVESAGDKSVDFT